MSSFPRIYYIHMASFHVRLEVANESTLGRPTVLRNGERMKLSSWAPSLDLGPETVSHVQYTGPMYLNLWPQ